MIAFVTGTGTDVGKTITTAALAAALDAQDTEVVVLKPVQTGEPEGEGDIFTAQRLAGVRVDEYVRYPEPLAPNLSARRAGMDPVGRDELVEWIRSFDAPGRVVLVEGAGGLLVRLADELTLPDLAAELNAPLLVVSSLGLGSLNAAELTVREAQRRGLEVLGLIGGSLDPEPDLATELNIAELSVVTGVPLLGSVPAGVGELTPEDFREMARTHLGAAAAAVV